jgi:predicted ATP-binding protein involved in virulence
MKEPIYFLDVELDNIRSFTSKQLLDLSDEEGNWKKWTVILGDNGLGKTTVLQVLSAISINVLDRDFDRGFKSKFFPLLTIPQNIQLNSFSVNATLFNETLKLTKSNISKFTANLNYFDINGTNGWGYTSSVGVDNKLYFMNVYSYGANRIMGNSSLAESLSNDNSETLFDDSKTLINAEEWLLQLDYAASKESSVKDFAIKKRDQVKKTLIDLLPDVNNIRFTEPKKTRLKSAVEFQTAFGWRSLHELSLGYRTMIAWMVDLAARMFRDNPDSDNPLAEPAIVLVDEIDLHLHPKWQRNIFTYLSDKFPNCQFIVTAHSPLVVQSAPKEANLVVLRKEGDKVIIDNDIDSVRNWRLDQIMSSDLFGGTARNVEIENELKERTTLLKKNELTKEEEKRLFKLNEMANNLPTGSNDTDIEAMQIIRKAADFIKSKSN